MEAEGRLAREQNMAEAKPGTVIGWMKRLAAPRRTDNKRRILAIGLGLIAVALVFGGLRLAMLGGSIYYLLAGLCVLGSAYFTWRGDVRGRWVYALLLAGTLGWSIWERGVNPWGLQARLLAPAVLGIWVFWPSIRLWPKTALGVALITTGALVWLMSDTIVPASSPASSSVQTRAAPSEWLHYGNDLGGKRYASLSQITPANVGRLHEAWRIRTGAKKLGLGFEATPLFIRDTLYLCTPETVVIALDPDTGKRRWTYDPEADVPPPAVCRGVAYHAQPGVGGVCAERILVGTVDGRLIAIDRRSGKPCKEFGNDGIVDLTQGLGPFPEGVWRPTSAPLVVRGKVILGGMVVDNMYVGEPSGVVRAFDAVTGKLAWAWDLDRPHEKGMPSGGETYSTGTPNSWAPMSADDELGLVYIPTGSGTPDYWGGHRSPNSDKYGSAVVALDAETGDVRWSFQTTHHDLWDYDVASQPTLVDLPIEGRSVPALIQPTKRGQVFVLDRRTGEPLTKVEEKPVPQGAADGDFVSPTQPYSIDMPRFDDATISEAAMWGMTPLDQMWCRIKFRKARYEGNFTPPGIRPTITYPSYQGGMNWGGVSVDPERRLMVVNWNRLASYTRLIPRSEADAMGVKLDPGNEYELGQPDVQKGTPFAVATAPFWSPLIVPCTEPPFGKIAVVDLDRRKIVWQQPLGTSRDIGPLTIPFHLPLPMGVPSIGGSVITKTGLVFIGATQERMIRAFDIRNGRMLWSSRLPAGGQATPMTFVSPHSGRQYVVIAAGGQKAVASKMGDYVIAFALPD